MDEQPITPETPKEPESNSSVPSVAPVAASTPSPSETPTVTSASPTPAKKSSKMIIWLIGIVILLVIGGGAWWWHSHNNKKIASTTSTAPKDVPKVAAISEGPYNDFYPFLNSNTGEAELQIDLYDGLVEYHQITKITPALATSWDNPDNNTWVFHLRKNVKFHTGRIMTASDVKYSITVAQADDALTPFTSTLKDVTVVDPNTIKITTMAPDPILLNRLTQLAIIDSQDTTKNDPNAGTGPFEVKTGTTPTADNIDMVAYDDYWNGRPHVRELDFTTTGTNAQNLQALYSGKADFSGYIDPSAKSTLPSHGDTTYTHGDVADYYIYLNTVDQTSPLSKLAVRQALRYIVNPQAIIKARGIDGTPSYEAVPPLIPGYNPGLSPISQDVVKGKQLLAQAGYPNGLTLTLSFYQASLSVANELQKEFAAAGITLKLDSETDIATITHKTEGGQAQMWWEGNSTAVNDLSDVVFPTLQNPPTYDSPQVDALMKQANATFDAAARLKLLQQVTQIIYNDVPIVPIYVPKYQYGYNAKLKNVTDDVNSSIAPGINWAKVYE